MKTCPDCNGDGVIEKGTDDERQCPTCGGSGFVPDDDEDEEAIRSATGLGVSSRTVQTAEDLAQNADRMALFPSHHPAFRLPDCLPTFSGAFAFSTNFFFSAGRSV